MKEELTTKMHSEFTIDHEIDIQNRVWSLMRNAEMTEKNPDDLLSIYNLTKEELDKYRQSYLDLNK